MEGRQQLFDPSVYESEDYVNKDFKERLVRELRDTALSYTETEIGHEPMSSSRIKSDGFEVLIDDERYMRIFVVAVTEVAIDRGDPHGMRRLTETHMPGGMGPMSVGAYEKDPGYPESERR